jgi:hypothetical protein
MMSVVAGVLQHDRGFIMLQVFAERVFGCEWTARGAFQKSDEC